MWRRKPRSTEAAAAAQAEPGGLKQAVRHIRIESAEKSGVVVDLRDAELARLELLHDALDPLFAEIAPEVELFDRGISRGDTPRLWIDAIAHVAMGRDKRCYRFVQDTRYGRKVLAESNEMAAIVDAVRHYVAARIIERERALAADDDPLNERLHRTVQANRRRQRRRAIRTFLLGIVLGAAGLFVALWIAVVGLS
jgi:hypothetical protein